MALVAVGDIVFFQSTKVAERDFGSTRDALFTYQIIHIASDTLTDVIHRIRIKLLGITRMTVLSILRATGTPIKLTHTSLTFLGTLNPEPIRTHHTIPAQTLRAIIDLTCFTNGGIKSISSQILVSGAQGVVVKAW